MIWKVIFAFFSTRIVRLLDRLFPWMDEDYEGGTVMMRLTVDTLTLITSLSLKFVRIGIF